MSQTADPLDKGTIIDKYTPKPPKQVSADMAAADEIRKQMAQPAATAEAPDESQQPPPQQAPVAPPSAQEPPLEAGETWEQRARSAQGRLEREAQLNKALNDRLAELEKSMSTLQLNRPADPEPAAPQPVKLVTDQERTDFGEDFLNVVGKRAKEEYAPEFDQLSRRLKQIEARVDGTVQVVTRNQKAELYATLDGGVPNWREINRAPEFKQWLGSFDPLSGRKRNDMLQEAFTRQEAGRVVSFFRGFLSEATGTPSSQLNPSPTASSQPNGSTATTGGALTLEQLAAPGRARSAPQGHLTPEKPVYTRAWIERFMADKRTGKYRGREADADAIERDIYQAQHEGRIQ